jgi:methylmalonyl-CoA mutase N-terminal domain/subunit
MPATTPKRRAIFHFLFALFAFPLPMTESTHKSATQGECKAASPSGLPMEAVVTPDDLQAWNAERDLGYPGEFPFTRGVYPTMYRGRLWTTRQYAGFGSAMESNQRYRYLLAQGVKGLSIAFDLPTQIGMDSDHALAQGEVGKVGVAIDSLEDMQTLFDGIPLETVSTSMTINATAAILLALYAWPAQCRMTS